MIFIGDVVAAHVSAKGWGWMQSLAFGQWIFQV